jgi:hypothetical protein
MSELNPAFAKALEERKKAEKQAAAAPQYQPREYEKVEWLTLEDKKEKCFRVIGDTIESRSKPSDPKLVLQSQILKDDKKGYIKVNWPHVKAVRTVNGKKKVVDVPDPEWILTELYDKINEGRWEKYSDGHTDSKGKNGYWRKFNTGTESFERVDGNTKQGDAYSKHFYPAKRVVLNVLDRHDTWCEENKHFKLLTAKRTPYTFEYTETVKNAEGEDVEKLVENTIYYTDTGIPLSVYNKMFDHFLKYVHGWNADAVMTKLAEEKSYDVTDITDDRYVSDEIKEIGSDQDLTLEEMNYGTYDLDKLFGLTTYNKLLENLKGLFKLADEEFETDFYDRLLDLAQKEREEWEKEDNAADEAKSEDEKKQEVSETKDTSVEQDNLIEEVEEKKQRRRAPVEEEVEEEVVDDITEEQLCANIYSHWNDLSEKEKETFLNSIDHIEDKVVIFKRDADELLCPKQDCRWPESNKLTAFPGTIKVCPVCGTTE